MSSKNNTAKRDIAKAAEVEDTTKKRKATQIEINAYTITIDDVLDTTTTELPVVQKRMVELGSYFTSTVSIKKVKLDLNMTNVNVANNVNEVDVKGVLGTAKKSDVDSAYRAHCEKEFKDWEKMLAKRIQKIKSWDVPNDYKFDDPEFGAAYYCDKFMEPIETTTLPQAEREFAARISQYISPERVLTVVSEFDSAYRVKNGIRTPGYNFFFVFPRGSLIPISGFHITPTGVYFKDVSPRM